MTNTSEMTRKQMGLLKVRNKSYPIYEGLNVIGRDLKATVLVKDETFSRQHAVISVVDENTHLVSDFGSSNGTRLGKKCLIPYKFYRINDQERIIISDAICSYQKTTGLCKSKHTSIRINENVSNTESQFDGYDAPTQVLPKNINEPPKQSVVNCLNASQDIYLAPTQVIFKQPQNSDKNSNKSLTDNDDFIPSTQDFDKPTQKYDFVLQDKSNDSNKGIKQNQLNFVTSTQDHCFTPTERYDDVLASETLRLSVNNHDNIGIEVDESMLVNTKTHIESDNESVDMLNTEQVSQSIRGAGEEATRNSEICNQKRTKLGANQLKSTGIDTEKCKEPACENNDKKCDNFETSFRNYGKIEQVKIVTKEHNGKSTIINDQVFDHLETDIENNDITRNNDDDSETDVEVHKENTKKNNIRNASEKIEDDDSETDMDDKIIKKKVTRRKKVRKQLDIDSKKVDDDSETDIEDFSKTKTKKLGTRVQFIQSDSETDIENNKNLEKLKNNSLCSANNKNEDNRVNNVIDVNSGSETEIEDEAIISKMKNIETISTSKNESATEGTIPEKKENVEQGCYSSEEEIDLLAPTQKLTDDFTDKNIQLSERQIDAHIDNNERSCEDIAFFALSKRSNEETYSLAPTQLLEPLQTSSDTNTYEVSIHEAETQIVEDDENTIRTNKNPELSEEIGKDTYSLAPTQLLKQTTSSSCSKKDINEENVETNSLAPTQLLQSEQKSSDTKKNKMPIEEEETQLVDHVKISANKIQQEQIEDSYSLAPTQLLQPAQKSSNINQNEIPIEETETQPRISSNANQHEKQAEDIDYLAPTQLLKHLSSNRNNEDEDTDYLAPTQLLHPVARSTKTKQHEEQEDSDYLQPTQRLQLNCSKSTEVEDYLAPTQLLSFRNEANSNSSDDGFPELSQKLSSQSKSAKEIIHKDSDDDIFLVPTQKLSLSNKKSSYKKTSLPKDILSMPTKKLPENANQREENEDDHEDYSISSAPTQKLTSSPRISLGMKHKSVENEDAEDDDFMAPTQLLKMNTNMPKSSEIYDFSYTDDPHYINIDYSSEDTSMKLAISCNNEDEDFIAPTQQLELPKNIPAGSANKEEKTAKLTEVPNNSAKLPEPETQLEVEFALSTQKLYIEKATSRPNNPLANMFDEENTELTETDNVMDIVPSKKKTESDTSQNLSSNIDTSDSSLIEQSKKRSCEDDSEESNNKRSKRNVRQPKNKIDVIKPDIPRRTSKRAEAVNSKYSKANIVNKDIKHEEVTSTPKKQNRKIKKKEENPFEEGTKIEPSTSDIDLKRNVSDDKHSEKNKSDKSYETESEKNLETPRRMSTRAGRKTEERELETPRKMAGRRGKKTNDTKLESHLEDKQESENVDDKELLKNKEISDIKVIVSNLKKDEESKKEEVYYKKPSAGQTAPKKEIKRPNRKPDISSNMKQEIKNEANTRITRNKSSSTEASIDFGSSKENISKLIDTISKTKKTRQNAKKTKARQMKNKSVDNEEEEKITIEDSDDSTNSNIEEYIRKKVLKIEYTDESCSGSSIASTVVPNLRHNKRSLKIEDYSSDENPNKKENTNLHNTFCDTPNNKRRKYAPLNITTNNSSETSNTENGSIKHKIVFTMLNNPELETTVKTLGGTTIDSVHTCTALVTNKISRSLKFLIAVSLGKPIVDIKWITESSKKKMFLDPWDYLLEDPESENKFKISLKESLQRAKIKKLLTGYTILLVVNKNFDVLKEIIETCGGKCVTRAPAKSAGANVVVVAYEDEKSKYSRYLKQRTVVAAEAIFSGVLSQQLNFENHLLL